jgi:hypothetical protein
MFVEYTVEVVYTGATCAELGVAGADEEEINSARVDGNPDMTELTGLTIASDTAEVRGTDEVVGVSLTGQTVVYNATSSVVTEPIFEEHSMAPAPQELTVYTLLV